MQTSRTPSLDQCLNHAMAHHGPLWPILVHPTHRPGDRAGSIRAPPTDRLGSWKAIAAYLDSSVRTVRRWVAAEDYLYIATCTKARRVFALRGELDAWRTLGRVARIRRPALAPPRHRRRRLRFSRYASAGLNAEDDYFADGLTDDHRTCEGAGLTGYFAAGPQQHSAPRVLGPKPSPHSNWVSATSWRAASAERVAA